MSFVLIYLVTNLANDKKYVGQTRRTLRKRWNQHVYSAVTRRGNTLLGAAIRKYGPDGFSISVLCMCSSQDELDVKEQEYISSLGTHSSTGRGYNLTLGGFGGQHGAHALRLYYASRLSYYGA